MRAYNIALQCAAGRLVACRGTRGLALLDGNLPLLRQGDRQRSKGRSAVAAAAYRSASNACMTSASDRSHDYTAKAGVVHSEIMLPEGAPDRWLDRGCLVERGRGRLRSGTTRSWRARSSSAIPRELGQSEAYSGWPRTSCASSSWRAGWWRTSTCIGRRRRTASAAARARHAVDAGGRWRTGSARRSGLERPGAAARVAGALGRDGERAAGEAGP